MSLLVKKCWRVLMVKDDYVYLIACSPVGVNYDSVVNGVPHWQVLAKEIEKMLLIYFSHYTTVSNCFRRQSQLRRNGLLLCGKCRAEKGFPVNLCFSFGFVHRCYHQTILSQYGSASELAAFVASALFSAAVQSSETMLLEFAGSINRTDSMRSRT